MTTPLQDSNRLKHLQLSLQLHGMLGMGAGVSIAVTSSMATSLMNSGYDTAGRIVIAAALLPCLVGLWAVLRMMRIWNDVVAELDAEDDAPPAGDEGDGEGAGIADSTGETRAAGVADAPDPGRR